MEAMFNLVENLESEEISFTPSQLVQTEVLCGNSQMSTICGLSCGQ